MRQRLLSLILGIGIGLAVLWPILPPSVWYPMHDATSPERVTLMRETILGGQFPPIWASTINGGYGYPLFHFYAPLFHLFATTLSFVTSVTTALKVTLLVSTVVGVLGVMRLTRPWGRLAGATAAVALFSSPFLALELYVRGAFAEYLSLCLLPLVLATTQQIMSRRQAAVAALTLALFVLSHNLTPLLALPLILVWMVYSNSSRLRLVLGTILLAIGLSAWFTIPLLFERHFTKVDSVARTTSYAAHFVEPWQMWNSTWGFGGSAAGVEDGMSFKLGKLQLILGVLGLALALVKRKQSLILLGCFLALSTFLATAYSKFVWDLLPTLQLVQFPWRALGIAVVMLSPLVAFVVGQLPRSVRLVAATMLILGFWRLGHSYFAPQSLTPLPTKVRDIAKVVPEYETAWWDPSELGQSSSSLHLAYYPTHVGIANHKRIRLYPDKAGLTAFVGNYDKSEIKVFESHTRLERLSYAITLLTIGAVLGLLRERV